MASLLSGGSKQDARFARVAEIEARVPSLRNVALTAPYMHDGRMATLESVIAHYAAGPNPDNDDLGGFELGVGDLRAVVAFLESLTEDISENGECLMDGEFMLNEFVDRYGPRLAHLNGVLHVLSQLSSVPNPTSTTQ